MRTVIALNMRWCTHKARQGQGDCQPSSPRLHFQDQFLLLVSLIIFMMLLGTAASFTPLLGSFSPPRAANPMRYGFRIQNNNGSGFIGLGIHRKHNINLHNKINSKLFYNFPTDEMGPYGKPAASKEEDLEKTIAIILQHQRFINGEGEDLDVEEEVYPPLDEQQLDDTDTDTNSNIDDDTDVADEGSKQLLSSTSSSRSQSIQSSMPSFFNNAVSQSGDESGSESIVSNDLIVVDKEQDSAQDIINDESNDTDATDSNNQESAAADDDDDDYEKGENDNDIEDSITGESEQGSENTFSIQGSENVQHDEIISVTSESETLDAETVAEEEEGDNASESVVTGIPMQSDEELKEVEGMEEEAAHAGLADDEKEAEEPGENSDDDVAEAEFEIESDYNQTPTTAAKVVPESAVEEPFIEEPFVEEPEVEEHIVEEPMFERPFIEEQPKNGNDSKQNSIGISFDAATAVTTTPSTPSTATTEVSIATKSLTGSDILSTLTSCFPIFVLSAAITGIKKPQLLTWVNRGAIIPIMLGAVMTFMGMTLSTQDFKDVLSPSTTSTQQSNDNNVSSVSTSSSSSIAAIPVGVSCQYLIMPLTAYIIGSTMLLPSHTATFLGLILVGCSPGGTASNLVSLIAKADVALSVILTSASTLLASLLTPLLVKVLIGSTIAVSGAMLCKATAQVILGPIVLGMFIRKVLPNLADLSSKYAPFAGVVLVSLLCGGVVAQNSAIFLSGGADAAMIRKIILSVLGLHTVGFGFGYFMPRKIFGLSERTARTISIETGMQNSALAVVLAKSVVSAMEEPTTAIMSLAMLPGAMSATAHSCLGSALAVYWRFVDAKSSKKKSSLK